MKKIIFGQSKFSTAPTRYDENFAEKKNVETSIFHKKIRYWVASFPSDLQVQLLQTKFPNRRLL